MLPYLQRSDGYGRTPTTVDPYEEQVPEEELAQLNEADTGGTQWYTNVVQLEKIADDVDYKTLGTLNVGPAVLEKTAERYMDSLNDSIVFLFEAVSKLSENINSYFVVKNRGTAINKGNAAIENADTIANQMTAQTAETEAEEDEI